MDPAPSASHDSDARLAPLRLFRGAPLGSRLHLAIRWQLMPFLPLLAHVPERLASALDVGCGHGLWALLLAAARPGAQVVGVDPDRPRVAVAQACADRRQLRARFLPGTMQDVADGTLRLAPDSAAAPETFETFDLISVIDALYLLPRAQEAEVVAGLAARLRPGGRLFLKEMGDRPRWKRAWNHAQESLAVRLLGITVGDAVQVRTQDECRALLTGAGLRVTEVPLDRGYLHPHLLLIGEKPAGM